MEAFRADGHLSEAALLCLISNQPTEELTRLEIAEHLAFCDLCLQHYTELLEGIEPETPEHSCRNTLWPQIRLRALRLFPQRYATAAAAVALALTLLWGSGHPAFLAASKEIEATLKPHTEAWPEQWDEALSGFSGRLQSLFDKIGAFQEELKGEHRP